MVRARLYRSLHWSCYFRFPWAFWLPLPCKSIGSPSIIWLTFTSGLCEEPLTLATDFYLLCAPKYWDSFRPPSCSYYCLCSQLCSLLCRNFPWGIDTIPRGQYEAAKVLKFSPFDRVRYIILPQVTKIVLPSVFNEVMSLVKDTSLVYALGISDLILASRTAANRDASLVPMFLAGAIYLILIGIVTIISKKLRRSIVIIDRRLPC